MYLFRYKVRVTVGRQTQCFTEIPTQFAKTLMYRNTVTFVYVIATVTFRFIRCRLIGVYLVFPLVQHLGR